MAYFQYSRMSKDTTEKEIVFNDIDGGFSHKTIFKNRIIQIIKYFYLTGIRTSNKTFYKSYLTGIRKKHNKFDFHFNAAFTAINPTKQN